MVKQGRKWLAVLLAVLLIVGACPVTALAADSGIRVLTAQEKQLHDSAGANAPGLEAYVGDVAAFRAYLLPQLAQCKTEIDISAYNIPLNGEALQALADYFYYSVPEAFHVGRLGGAGASTFTILRDIQYLDFANTQEKYQACLGAMQSAADQLLDGIRGNAALTELQKALLLHDRLAVWAEYDGRTSSGAEPYESHTASGALGKKVAVCQGYAMAYMYLLEQVGIRSTYCSSYNLNHGWNIVYLDGKAYHVDVTWDDPTLDWKGRVDHKNFLRSTTGIISTKHTADDYDTSPTDTTYDAADWQNSDTEYQLVNGQLYCMHKVIEDREYKAKIYRVTDVVNGGGTLIKTLSDLWQAKQEGYYWVGNYSRLSSAGDKLLYSTPTTVVELDPVTGSERTVYTYTPGSQSPNHRIYGFTYCNGELQIELSNTPDAKAPASGVDDGSIDISEPYDTKAPTASLTATNRLAAEQTVAAAVSDDTGVVGYYWCRSSDYKQNTYTKISTAAATAVDIPVSASGTYYFVAVDAAGNASAAQTCTFYCTKLDANGGSAVLSSVLTPAGQTFSFPVTSRAGYTYKGWAASKTAAAGAETLTPTGDATYYAIWEEIPVVLTGVQIKTPPAKTQYYLGDMLDLTGLKLLLTYSDSSQKETTAYDSVSGFDVSVAGQQTITVAYQGKTATFTVQVDTPTVTLSSTAETLKADGTVRLSAVTTPVGLAVSWSVADTQIATVDENGTVTALKAGTTMVTASIVYQGNTYRAVCTLMVRQNGVMRGDLNGDGTVDAKDVTYLRRALAKWQGYTIDRTAGDLNGDGTVDAKDVTYLRRALAKWQGYTV